MASSGMLRRVDIVIMDVSDELIASFIRVTRIGQLLTTLAATSNRRTLRRNTKYFLQEPHGVTSQKTPFVFPTCYCSYTVPVDRTAVLFLQTCL
jgi:hypothetical protein